MTFFQHFLSANTYGFLIKREVKMAGYCQVLFACLWREIELKSINSQKKKKEQERLFSHLEQQAWSIPVKDLL